MKFMENARYGGWSDTRAGGLLRLSQQLFTLPHLQPLAEFRS
jgi:hypothetical protein